MASQNMLLGAAWPPGSRRASAVRPRRGRVLQRLATDKARRTGPHVHSLCECIGLG